VTLTRELRSSAQFSDCADATWRVAGDLFGAGSAPQHAVAEAWKSVGVPVSASVMANGPRLPLREAAFTPPMAAGEFGADLPRARRRPAER
jgi:hypothetical protein